MANKDQGSDAGMTRKQRRAAERAARKDGKRSTTRPAASSGPSMLMISIGAVVIGLIAVIGLVLVSGGLGDDNVAVAMPPDDRIAAEDLRVGRSLGDPEAPVRIEAYEDPRCPHCATFTERIEPLLVNGPVRDGEVFFTYKDFPFLSQQSFDASVAMRVAEEMDGAFWDYHAIMFHNQANGDFSAEHLADMAEAIGLDRAEFLERMDDPAHLAAVEAEVAEGQAAGVNSTPSLLVNGELVTNVQDWDQLRSLIDAAAEQAA